MVALLAALALAAGSANTASGDFTDRMRQSAAAAEALQGALDGAWLIKDRLGRVLYVLQITDASGPTPPLDAAWRTGASPSRAGPVDEIMRQGDRLRIRFVDPARGGATTLALRRREAAAWTGTVTEDGRTSPVTLSRSPR